MEEITREEVYKSLQEEINNLKELSKNETEDNKPIQEQEGFKEALSIEQEKIVKILLSWGGGEDGYKLTFKNGELLRGVYYMANWGTYNEIELNEEELSLIFETYLYGEEPTQI